MKQSEIAEIDLQEKCRKFVENQRLLCQSSLVEHLFEKLVFEYDDIENAYASPENCECGCKGVASDCDCAEPQEIYEWWCVDDWFANKLREHNEPILENDYGIWWGRTCSGQAILLDSVIEQIVKGFDSK